MPGLGREASPGHTRHGTEIVIPEPHADNILAGEAHEPGVAKGCARSGFSRRICVVELAPAAGACKDDGLEHVVQRLDNFAIEDLLARWLIALVVVDDVIMQGTDFLDAVGAHLQPARRKHRIAAGVLERRHASIAKSH